MTDEPLEITVDQTTAPPDETVTGAVCGGEGLMQVHLARVAMHLPGTGRAGQQITEFRQGVKTPPSRSAPIHPVATGGDGPGRGRYAGTSMTS